MYCFILVVFLFIFHLFFGVVSLRYQINYECSITNFKPMTKFIFTLSDHSLNSQGCWVLTSGIDLSRYVKNPIVLFNHKRANDTHWSAKNEDAPLTIGRCSRVWVDGEKLMGEIEFDEKDGFAVKIKDKVEGGFLNSVSIGFRIIELSEAALLIKSGQRNPTITKAELMEVSIVDLPANPNATNRALFYADDTTPPLDEAGIVKLSGNFKPKNTDMNKLVKGLIALFALAADATEEQLLAHIEAVKVKADKSDGLEAELSAQKIKTLLDTAEADGRFSAAARPAFEKLAAQDFAQVTAVLSAMPTAAVQGNGQLELTDALAKLSAGTGGGKAAADWKGEKTQYAYLLKYDAAEFMRLSREDPARFAELEKEWKTSK